MAAMTSAGERGREGEVPRRSQPPEKRGRWGGDREGETRGREERIER